MMDSFSFRQGPITPSETGDKWEKFIKALRELPSPPCDGCYYSRVCANDEIACRDFQRYASRGYGYKTQDHANRVPTRRIWEETHRDHDKA